MGRTKEQREDRALDGLHCDGAEVDSVVVHEVLGESLVVDVDQDQSADREEEEHEEEAQEEDVGQLVREVGAEEVAEFLVEVEGELLYVALVEDEEDEQPEGVLAQVDGDPVVKEQSEEQPQQEEDGEGHGQLVVEEIQVVSKETAALIVFSQEVRVCVVVLVAEGLKEGVVGVDNGQAETDITLSAVFEGVL